MNSTILLKNDVDVRTWISPIKLTYTEVCKKYGIDITNDRRNAFFWNLLSNSKIVINEDVLTWCGYSGEYRNMKTSFAHLLRKNSHILYNEIRDEKNDRKSYYVLESLDFETLLMQMRSRKAQEIRELFTYLKHISTQYIKYEKYYKEYQNQLIRGENSQLVKYNIELVQSVNELKDLVLQVKDNAAKDAEAAKERAEIKEKLAEKNKNEMSNKLDIMTNKIDDIRTNVSVKVVDRLRQEVSPLVAPEPVNSNKERCLALINTVPGYEWYIVRRQRETFNRAIGKILKKYDKERPTVVKRWYKISHSVDVGNSLKNRLRNLRWLARGNILRAIDQNDGGPTYSNETLVREIEDILENNIATKLSGVTEKLIN